MPAALETSSLFQLRLAFPQRLTQRERGHSRRSGAGKAPGNPPGTGAPCGAGDPPVTPGALPSSFDIFRLCAAEASSSHPHVPTPEKSIEIQAEREGWMEVDVAGQERSFHPGLGLQQKSPQFLLESFPAPRWCWSCRIPRGWSSCAWMGGTTPSINTHTLGLGVQTRLLGQAERAWRCFVQASSKNKT